MYECIINGIPARVECQIEFVCLYEELLVLVENYVEREDDELLKMFNFHLKGGAVHKRNFLKDSFELSVSKILKRF